jgi:gluconate 2-dehydrogenase gamma chain
MRDCTSHNAHDYFASPLSRRGFIKGMLWAGVVSQIPFIPSCEPTAIDLVLSQEEKDLAKAILHILWPSDGFGPDVEEIKAVEYIQWTLHDPLLSESEASFLKGGFEKFNQYTQEKMHASFLSLNPEEQENSIAQLSRNSWGEKWLSSLLTLLMEAMLSDPTYGFNQNATAWKWLNHQGGIPRPKEGNLYPEIIEHINP